MREEQVDELLNKWYDLKETIKQLENKMDEYKEKATQIMREQNTTVLSNDKYNLEKKETSRMTISLADIKEEEIKRRYAKTNVYSCFYISKKGEKKKRSRNRSPKKIK